MARQHLSLTQIGNLASQIMQEKKAKIVYTFGRGVTGMTITVKRIYLSFVRNLKTSASVQVPLVYTALVQARLTRTHVNASQDIPEQTVILVIKVNFKLIKDFKNNITIDI
uniref:Uncharacterized protein n=1 Tax=Magallana gigas TaxID=29159 RepID=A0A8W8NE26_MAGGI